jgi:hypothetical protein
MARSMLKAKSLSGIFWREVVAMVVYVLNHCSTKGVIGKMPYEAWHGHKPTVHHLCTFGCVAHVKNTAPNLKKLDNRSRPMIFIGYEEGTKGYRMYDPSTERVCVTHNVVFDEQAQWDWVKEEQSTSDGVDDTFIVEYMVSRESQVDEGPAVTGPRSPGDQGGWQSPGSSSVGHSSDRNSSLAKAHVDQNWQRAMEDEMAAIEDNKTWVLSDLPPGCRAIRLKWVFKVKHNEQGAVVKYKARLVVQGYAQRRGIDYDEVFAPVARLDTVRLLISLAALKGWEVHHMDVKSAFLNGDLRDEVYVEQSEGFIKKGCEHKVIKLKKALYGLHQAPRA